VAETLMDQASKHLASAARAVAGHLTFPARFPVVLSGGAFKACPSVVQRVEHMLEDLDEAEVRPLAVEPAMGAVTLALEMLR
jgi:N-acetylglucosamine kinase-like BadF-type ATPase